MRHRCVFWFVIRCCKIVVLIAVVLEIVTKGVCLCVTTPRATSRKTAPFCFIRIRQSRYFLADFVSEKHLFVAYFASKCKLLDKDESEFYHIDILRVYQKQNLALSRFKPASTLTSKCECWYEFEKDFEVFRYSFSDTIPLFCIRLSTKYCQCFTFKSCKKIRTEMY